MEYKLIYEYRGDLWTIEGLSYTSAKLKKEELEKELNVKVKIVPIK